MDFFEFLDTSVTPYHTVETLKKMLASAGFSPVGLENVAGMACGETFFVERDSALIAVRMPRNFSADTRDPESGQGVRGCPQTPCRGVREPPLHELARP